jgi:sarcosine oxidase subunit beta
MSQCYDAVIIGGGIIGMSTAHYLSQESVKLAVIERKYIGSGSTGRCIGGIRQQFSTPASIRLMKENVRLFSEMEDLFGFSVEFHQGGYLLLAHNQDLADVFRANVELQQSQGVDVNLVTPAEISKIVPHLNLEDVVLGTFCPSDAQIFPFAILKGYRQKLAEKNQQLITHNPVIAIQKNKNYLITLADQTQMEAEKILICAGPWSNEIAAMLNLSFPLFPERHEAMITERMPAFLGPMIVDYREDGCYFNQLISGQIIGCYTPHPNVPGIHEDSSFDFLPNMAWRMTRLVPALKNASILRHWAGCYTMTPDGSPIVDETDLENCYIATGMCGHGLMFGPSIGKHLAHFMIHKNWDFDLSEFRLKRSFTGKEKLK